MDDTLKTRIDEILTSAPVVLFMKGTKSFPQCGFSATVIEVLKRSGVTQFRDVNILADAELRQGMKDYASWPTFPQLYVGGKFVGGCDIVRDMFTSGELKPVLEEALGTPASS